MWVCLLKPGTPSALTLRGLGWVRTGALRGERCAAAPQSLSGRLSAAAMGVRGLHSAADPAPPAGGTLCCAS